MCWLFTLFCFFFKSERGAPERDKVLGKPVFTKLVSQISKRNAYYLKHGITHLSFSHEKFSSINIIRIDFDLD